MSITWHQFPDIKPSKTGTYLVFSSDEYQTGRVIKTRRYSPYRGWDYEVIGNIHENPELLEEKSEKPILQEAQNGDN